MAPVALVADVGVVNVFHACPLLASIPKLYPSGVY